MDDGDARQSARKEVRAQQPGIHRQESDGVVGQAGVLPPLLVDVRTLGVML